MALLVPAARKQSGSQNYTSGARPSNTMGTVLTASATPHTLGSITQIIASTTYEAEWFRIYVNNSAVSATITDQLLNIYVGGAGSEVLFIDSLLCGWAAPVASGAATIYWFPVRIPRGTRISGALRALIASDTVQVMIDYGVSNGEHWVGGGIETLGADTANSRGTAVTPGSTSDGSWATIGTSGRRYRYLMPGIAGNNDTSLVAETIAWDVGSSSAVYQNMADFWTYDSTSENQGPWLPRGWWCDVPSGTSLQVRGQSSTTPSGLQYACLYGVY